MRNFFLCCMVMLFYHKSFLCYFNIFFTKKFSIQKRDHKKIMNFHIELLTIIFLLFQYRSDEMIPYWLKSNYKTGLACLVIAVVDAISLRVTSIGILESYNVGACKIMPAVPTTTAIVKSHKNKRSSTIATYFQSSFTYAKREGKRKFYVRY